MIVVESALQPSAEKIAMTVVALTKACVVVRACNKTRSIQQHAEHNKCLVKSADKIPMRINRLVESQSAKVLEDVKMHADSIIADGNSIQSECKSVVSEYNQLIEDVHASKYTEAVQVLNDIIGNSERVVEQAKDAGREAQQTYSGAIAAVTGLLALLGHWVHRSP